MAEGIASKYLKEHFISSAGTLPEPVNPNAIISMKGIGIDISNNKSKKIDLDQLNNFDLVITLCGDAKDKCPVINSKKHIHWDISDPAKFKGTKDQIITEFSRVRDMIHEHIILLKDQLNKGYK
jgi:arsenate reductase (thioredoxin)